MIKWDGHTHTKFCKHGGPYELDDYIEQAVRLGFQRYSVTEHPPLPDYWVDDANLMAELAMEMNELPAYFRYVQDMKRRYEDRIELRAGLELDYLFEREAFSNRMLEHFGDRMEEAVVSVHYLPGKGGMRCVDFTSADFRDHLLSYYGSMDKVATEYYLHVGLAVDWAAKLPLPVRLGHVQLIEKFAADLPPIDPGLIAEHLHRLLEQLEKTGIGIDVNTAGMRVRTCGRPYVPEWFVGECVKRGIPLVFGSDAHKPEHVGSGWEWFERSVNNG